MALGIVDALKDDVKLRDYAPLPAVRGDLLQQLGRIKEAHAEFIHAAALSGNARECAALLARAENCCLLYTSRCG